MIPEGAQGGRGSTRLTDEMNTGLTLSLALGRITALATRGFLQVIGFGAAAAAQRVRLIATLSKRRRTLRLDRRENGSRSVKHPNRRSIIQDTH